MGNRDYRETTKQIMGWSIHSSIFSRHAVSPKWKTLCSSSEAELFPASSFAHTAATFKPRLHLAPTQSVYTFQSTCLLQASGNVTATMPHCHRSQAQGLMIYNNAGAIQCSGIATLVDICSTVQRLVQHHRLESPPPHLRSM